MTTTVKQQEFFHEYKMSAMLPCYFSELVGFPETLKEYVSANEGYLCKLGDFEYILENVHNALKWNMGGPIYGIGHLTVLFENIYYHKGGTPVLNMHDVKELPDNKVTLGEFLIALAQHLILHKLPFDVLYPEMKTPRDQRIVLVQPETPKKPRYAPEK